MDLQKCRDTYDYHSAKASDICRKLGFVGIGLIWAFKVTKGTDIIIPGILRWAGIFLIIGLTTDFLQYLSGAVIWGWYHRYKEKNGTTETDDFMALRKINWFVNTCFALKQIFIFSAYILLVIAMFNVFWLNGNLK